jgi:hypothetical protein
VISSRDRLVRVKSGAGFPVRGCNPNFSTSTHLGLVEGHGDGDQEIVRHGAPLLGGPFADDRSEVEKGAPKHKVIFPHRHSHHVALPLVEGEQVGLGKVTSGDLHSFGSSQEA